jgi:branched-chain amino acid transport system substrate-binding protein
MHTKFPTRSVAAVPRRFAPLSIGSARVPPARTTRTSQGNARFWRRVVAIALDAPRATVDPLREQEQHHHRRSKPDRDPGLFPWVKGQSMVCQRLIVAGVSLIAALYAPAADAEIRIATAGPITGPTAWIGEQYLRATEMAVAALNSRGGVLGQRVELIVGDDFCDRDQAVAVARKLASDGVVFVAGHYCSHSSIAAAKVYEEAGILQISPGSVSGKLTDEGRPNVFRVCGRDDQQGKIVADHLADIWASKNIAILDDGTTFGAGLADAVRRRLHELGVRVAINDTFTPGGSDYSALVSKMRTAAIDVFFVGALHPETGLIFRQAHDRGYDLRLVAPSSSAAGDFPMIAGQGIKGTFMAAAADARENPEAAAVVARFRAQGYDPVGFTLYAYAAVQVWAQAVEEAGSLDIGAVVKAMHNRQFTTVLGRIGFDERGDVTGFQPWQWYVWQADGTYVPMEKSMTNQ